MNQSQLETDLMCLAIANQQMENLMNNAAFTRMKPNACLVNVSRENLA